ncbi:Helix-turn-helix domain-containing protein [Pedobacter steynii]|uniref:Helix-turn-helix domain-containing protein n=1 Tax=Pedobacter steynii TaxID=430522 RepID=A0A1H0KMX8_9SPHI|nr:helix-turn-helix domain-containing protein [Pedobacter steynii]NQX43336.1 AraC family transcriptional regulator [Pedobacter steynii]SDO57327.1 Helix-turn-helix domain-containing protein [Pedobacter steynii]
MNIGKELLFFFSALGAFNGLILSLYFSFFTKKKYLSNYFLGALLFALSVRIGKSVFVYFDGNLPKIYLQIGLSACFFIGPLLYCFLKSAVKGLEVMPKSWKWMIALLFLPVLVVGICYPYENYPGLWNQYFGKVIYCQWFIFLVVSGFVIKDTLKKMIAKGQQLTAAEVWLLMIFFGNVVIFISFFLAMIRAPFTSYISGSIGFSLILYLIISVLLYRKKTDDLFLFSPNKYTGKKLQEEEAGTLLGKLERVMTEQAVYRNPDLKLSDLSKGIHVSSHQLSQLLNDNLGKNFTTFVNEFRINEACRIISTDHRLTLESIGYEVGFNSKSTFFAAFKKITGTTPLSYQQNTLKK